MFEARKRVFVDLLKWDVPVLLEKYELDQFDTIAATYLILTDDGGDHRASARLLRTDGPHILGNLFPHLCEGEMPSGTVTREITRFCIEPTLGRGERRTARNQLVTGLVQHALRSGIAGYTAVASLAWFRQIANFGWRCNALGESRDVGGNKLIALHIEIDTETPAALQAAGIYTLADFQTATAGELQ